MITLTTEQAQQIEKSLSGWKEYDAWTDQQMWNNDDEKALVTIRAARAQEQAEQEPVGVIGWAANIPNTMEEVHWEDECPPIGTTLYAAPVQQLEQEPVAIVDEIGLCLDGRPIFNAVGKVKVGQKLYAAPVHTTDLTDEEINALIDKSWIELMTIKEFVRAVIAADREKNNANNNT